MSELENKILSEKYRPKTFDELCLSPQNLEIIKNLCKKPKEIPSFLFYSSRPGTGKTSTARVIAKTIKCDFRSMNASDDRGIDSIRAIKSFCESSSFNPEVKRCVFLDEADGLTSQAQDSMRALMEEYSDNVFFILSCNKLDSIIEPIRKGRTVALDFSSPDRESVLKRLRYIAREEKIEITEEHLVSLMNRNYPDIRTTVSTLQLFKVIDGYSVTKEEDNSLVMKALKEKDVQTIYNKVNDGLDIKEFTSYYFSKVFEHYFSLAKDKQSIERIMLVSDLLADIEKASTTTANLKIVFLANMLKIMNGVKS